MICFAPGMGGAYVFLVAPCHRLAPAPRTGRTRARTRVGALAVRAASWRPRRLPGSPRRRPPDVCDLPLDPVRRLPRRAGLWERKDLRTGSLALAALVVPAALFLLWLRPIVNDTRSVSPDADEFQRAFEQYGGQLVVHSPTSYNLAPEVFTRAGAVAIAALLLIPLAGFAARRRWAAYVVGGALAVFAVMLVPFLFTSLADLVSISQARRAAGFLPFAFAFAGGHGSAHAARGADPPPARARRGDVLPDRLSGRLRLRAARSRPPPGSRGSRSSEPSPRSSLGFVRTPTCARDRRRHSPRPPSSRRSSAAAFSTGREPDPARARDALARAGRGGASTMSDRGDRATRIPRRASASPPSHPSTSPSPRRAMSPTRRRTARTSARRTRAVSSARATSRSRASYGADYVVVDGLRSDLDSIFRSSTRTIASRSTASSRAHPSRRRRVSRSGGDRRPAGRGWRLPEAPCR